MHSHTLLNKDFLGDAESNFLVQNLRSTYLAKPKVKPNTFSKGS